MRYIWNSALKDLRRRRRDPLALLLWLGIPFAVLAMLTQVFAGGSVQPQARLLVADEDGSLLSGLLTGAFGQGQLAELVEVEAVTPEAGRERIGRGEASALLLIPPGFGDDVLNDRPTRLTLLTNPSQSILPGIIEETLSLMVDAAFYLQRIAGEPLAKLAAGPPQGSGTFADDFIAATSVEINQVVGSIADYLFPPRLDVAVTVEEPEGIRRLDVGALFFQSMFFLAVLFVAQGTSDDIWLEERLGTLRRALTTPRGAGALLAGKLLAAFLLMLAISLLAIGAGALVYDLDLGRLPLAALWAAASGLALLVFFLLMQVFSTSQRAGSILTNMVMFPLMFIGGSFFPFEAMPDWLAAIGRWTPNGWTLLQFKSILAGSTGAADLGAAGAILLAFVLAGSSLTARRLRGGFGS